MSITHEPARRAPQTSVELETVGGKYILVNVVSQKIPVEVVGTMAVPRRIRDIARLHMRLEPTGATVAGGPSPEVELSEPMGDLVTAFISQLQDRQRELGEGAFEGVDALEVARRLIAVVPTTQKSPWDALVGPFYDTSALVVWRGLSRQRLSVLRRQDRLLGLKSADGEFLHPSFQFDAAGELLPRIHDVTRVLRRGITDEWTRAMWLNTPLEEWGGKSAAEKLRGTDDDASDVLALAEQDVASRLT